MIDYSPVFLFSVLGIVLLIVAILFLLFTSFMLFLPREYARFINWENDQWVRLGWISNKMAEQQKQIENHLALKFGYVIFTLVFFAATSGSFWAAHQLKDDPEYFEKAERPEPRPVFPFPEGEPT